MRDARYRGGGYGAHLVASPTPRPEPPRTPPKRPTKFGYWRCPCCEQWWTGLEWGRSCPECGCVRLADNWRTV